MSETAMSPQPESTHQTTSPQTAATWQTAQDKLARFGRAYGFWVVLIAATLLYSQVQYRQQPELGDRGNWDYIAQVIARGGVPYRDVVNIKSPFAAYVGAAAILVTRPFGVRDIFAIRVTFLFLAALTVALTFLVALECFDNLRVAALAALAMLTFSAFANFNSSGVQPKTPMVLFGLVSLWAMMKNRPFTAGIFSMLSALSWQPGLLFAGAAGLAASRYLTIWRDRRAFKVIAGAALPLAVLLIYYGLAGALRDFYLWNLHYPLTVYAPREMRTLGNFFGHLDDLLNKYHQSRWLFYLAIIGITVGLWLLPRDRAARRNWLGDAPRHAVFIAGVIYFAFCMIDIQGPMDLIPLLPFVAIFAAAAMEFIIGRLVARFAGARPESWRAALQYGAAGLLAVTMLYQAVMGIRRQEQPSPSLRDQDAIVTEIVAQLQPGDKVYVHGLPELLVLGKLTNASKYFFLDRGKDIYLDRVEPGGFVGWLERLKAERPKIIALGRFEGVEHEPDFMAWAAQDYEPRVNFVFTYYIRKDAGQ